MELPSVVHPKKIAINGFKFQVVSFSKLSDNQAFNAAMHFYNSHHHLKNRKKKAKDGYFTIKSVLEHR